MSDQSEGEVPVVAASIGADGVVRLRAEDALKIALPTQALNEIELGYAALLAAKFVAEAHRAGHAALAVLFARLAAALAYECERRQLPLESVVQAAAADLAAKTLLAAKPGSGGALN